MRDEFIAFIENEKKEQRIKHQPDLFWSKYFGKQREIDEYV